MDWLFLLSRESNANLRLQSTEDVFAESIRALRRRHPRAPGAVVTALLAKARTFIDEVVSDFAGDFIFIGLDADDYHVHAGAVTAGANFLLTQNRPTDITTTPGEEPYSVIAPDDFFMRIADSHPECLMPVVRFQYEYWSSRPDSITLDAALEKAGCPMFAARVKRAILDL